MPAHPLARTLLAFIAAVLLTYLVGCIAATQGALASLPAIAQPIAADVRLATTAADLLGMLPAYAPLIAAALVAGFVVAAFIVRRLPSLRTLGYILAGGIGIIAMHLIMRNTFDGIVPVAATRDTLGLALQGLAGALGGWLFARLSARPTMDPATVAQPSQG